MYLRTESESTEYRRISKLGIEHGYIRNKTVVVMQCDSCDIEFRRDLRKMDRKRLSNNYFHVCENCDAKRFAQRKGVEQKKIWDMPASTNLPVGKY
jgi:queuine/archaeosine tRNA-ribosyltransferase